MKKRSASSGAPCLVVLVLATAACGTQTSSHGQAIDQAPCSVVPIDPDETDEDALTARIIVTADRPVTITGDVDATIDGVTCGIAVYVAPGARAIIRDADIHSAEAFGVYNQGGQVTIVRSQVHDILGNGESCGGEGEETDDGCGGGGSGGMGGGGDDLGYTGGRHGTAVLFVGDGAQGTITGSTISSYGRRGLSVSGTGAFVHIANNQIVAPATPASWLNGIWVANGGRATIDGNTITGNLTPGPMGKSSSAIMIAGGPSHNGMPSFTTGIEISGNGLFDNDTGVLLSDPGLDGAVQIAPPVVTANHVTGNTIATTRSVASNDAGINDGGGNGDVIAGNLVTGYGLRSIVISPYSIDTVVQGNQTSVRSSR